MAFSAVLVGTAALLSALLVSKLLLGMPLLSAIGFSLVAGQTTFAIMLIKALVCRSLRRNSAWAG